ncbi:MAG: hypothetical protein ACXW0Q_07420 [Methylovulum sp.]
MSDAELTVILSELHDRAVIAYCNYINQLSRVECRGVEYKINHHEFGEAELNAHRAAMEQLGRHRALHEAADMLEEAIKARIEVAV